MARGRASCRRSCEGGARSCGSRRRPTGPHCGESAQALSACRTKPSASRRGIIREKQGGTEALPMSLGSTELVIRVKQKAAFSARVLATCILVVGFAPTPAQAHSWGCGQHLVSDTATQWTSVNPLESTGVFEQAAAIASPDELWASIPAGDGPTPQFIWTSSDGFHAGTPFPVVFTASFSGCSLIPYQGSLWINGDDAFVATLNGVPVAGCGTGPVAVPALQLRCFSDYQRVGVEILPVNELVIVAWNGIDPSLLPTPSMIQYRLDY